MRRPLSQETTGNSLHKRKRFILLVVLLASAVIYAGTPPTVTTTVQMPSFSSHSFQAKPQLSNQPLRPNLIIILTDQHNYRTLNCYREHLLTKTTYTPEQVNVWGDSPHLIPSTPHIDKLAKEGALFSNFYTVAPVCTPSRASFMTGLYPTSTFVGGAHSNSGPLNDQLTTWAEVLRLKGYRTSYMGKWHLDGTDEPGWDADQKPNRKFGFIDNQYRWNRGHWKYLREDGNKTMHSHQLQDEGLFRGVEDKHFTTDFLFDRGIEFVQQATEDNVPFALLLSIPDPHGPTQNQPKYRNMFDHLFFKYPNSAIRNMKYDPPAPGFNYLNRSKVKVTEVDAWVEQYEHSTIWQNYMRQYYGMVKCIDDNVGKLMQFVQGSRIYDDTIVVFTSDHGDQLMEHGKFKKNMPYEGSAGVPFVIRWPGVIPAGKIVETARSSIDFAPTILSLMGVDVTVFDFQGVDASQDILSSQMLVKDGSQVVISFRSDWMAAIKDGYKYIVGKGNPWLNDLNVDPEEMINYITDLAHESTLDDLRIALVNALKSYKFPVTEQHDTIFLDTPGCVDQQGMIHLKQTGLFCDDIGSEFLPKTMCQEKFEVRKHCPFTCGQCQCQDSSGPIWNNGSVYTCNEIKASMCADEKVNLFCPETCENTYICPSRKINES